MRKFILGMLLVFSCLCHRVQAQYDKYYFFWIGRNFIIDNKYQDAIETLNVLLRADETAYEAYFLRGIAKYNLDDLLGADQDFTLAIAHNPVYTFAYQYRAITRSRLGNYEDALADFHEAIDLRPDKVDVYYSRGVTYLLSEQYEKAIADFDMFLRREPKVVDAYINRGMGYLGMKDTISALADFDRAVMTNNENPEGYARRGAVYMAREEYDLALADFNNAIRRDSTHIYSYFNRAIVYSSTNRPMQAIADFDRIVEVDPENSLTYFNRAILRSQIGDYNRALDDYDKVAMLSPGNVLVYYNRAGLNARLGDYDAAIDDYSRAIELYPDFANAYIGRSQLLYAEGDVSGARSDRSTAEMKIAEYRSRLNGDSFSAYADTSRHFNQLLSFDTRLGGTERMAGTAPGVSSDITIMPLFKFTLTDKSDYKPITDDTAVGEVERFIAMVDPRRLALSNKETTLPTDSLMAIDTQLGERLRGGEPTWQLLFERGISQALVRQYTNAIASYTAAIDLDPSNAFLYMNRSTTQSEMIDFISSIDKGFQRMAVDGGDPANRLNNNSSRTYNYDDAIADLNKAAKLMPGFAYIYYNRANLYSRSGMLPEALEDYTRAIELNLSFGEAYYNRGLIQIFLKDTRKGSLDLSKAGELGIMEAYDVLKLYSQSEY